MGRKKYTLVNKKDKAPLVMEKESSRQDRKRSSTCVSGTGRVG